MSLQQIRKDILELKEAINQKTSRPDISKVKAELNAKLNQIRERMNERGELPILSTEEKAKIKEKVLTAIKMSGSNVAFTIAKRN